MVSPESRGGGVKGTIHQKLQERKKNVSQWGANGGKSQTTYGRCRFLVSGGGVNSGTKGRRVKKSIVRGMF
ncbi:MAG: hypothetical protein CM15mP87_05920 [Candidatus Neomarinimicrobiota bacterium]|nr:MAG: hypothetical protein CM15mP87_05920 [Candidatus Neomarinimicrobiota bacterium]